MNKRGPIYKGPLNKAIKLGGPVPLLAHLWRRHRAPYIIHDTPSTRRLYSAQLENYRNRNKPPSLECECHIHLIAKRLNEYVSGLIQ